MINIFLMQIKLFFSRKNIIAFLSVLFFISIIQYIKLNRLFEFYDVKGSSLDYMIYNLGGWDSQSVISYSLIWMIISLIYIYISIRVSMSLEDIRVLTLNRVNNRFKLWIINFISQTFLSVVIFLILFTISYFIANTLFQNKWTYSSLISIKYKHWIDVQNDAKSILGLISIIFISGMISLQMLIQVILIFQKSNSTMFIGFIIIFIIFSMGYIFGITPRVISPLFYSSTMVLNPTTNLLKNALITNIGISIISFIVGGYIFNSKDI